MSALDSALKLAEQGFYVFPVKAGDKIPLVKWRDDSTNDPAVISQWARKYQGANWGIDCGKSGVLVIDLDGEEARHHWDSLWMPDGAEVKTPHGYHVYYLNDGEVEIPNSVKRIHENIDVRSDGGYVVAPGSVVDGSVYTGDLSDVPELPQAVIELIPEKQSFTRPEREPDEPMEKPDTMSRGEERVLKGIIDSLQSMPINQEGAGYHANQFGNACFLWRIIQSPDYHTDEEAAAELFFKYARVYKGGGSLQEKRWESARLATEGQEAEPPGDVPVRLDAFELMDTDRFTGSELERLFWESKTIGDVKDLIRELRYQGATDQEAYSISYESSAMKHMRKRNPRGGGSTWGYTASIYEQAQPTVDEEPVEAFEPEIIEPPKSEGKQKLPKLLSEEEREIVRNTPNFIERYMAVAKEMFPEPNLPLHYVNAWLALSAACGDRAKIYFEGKTVPLSLWGLHLARSAAGKGDAKNVYEDVAGRSRSGGFADINIGNDASAEGLNNNLRERDGELALFFADECAALLRGMKDPRSFYYKFRTLALDLYDGKGRRALRSGMANSEAGESFDVVFNMWLQTTWENAEKIMDEDEIETGFIGRFLIAVGNPPKITKESLRPKLASDYQISLGGMHPMVVALADGVKTRLGARKSRRPIKFSDEVLERWGQSREDSRAYVKDHPKRESLDGILLRVTENYIKAAALHALSEGRFEVEITDLLLALKSGEHWIADSMKLVDAISSSEYRKRVEDLVKFVAIRPRTRAEILQAPKLRNLETRDLVSLIERADHEGQIRLDDRSKKWVLNE